jgi:tRNA 2-thiouridine synthesizing protein A
MVNQPDPRDVRLDLRGLKCPLPALRTRRVLTTLPAGAVLVVEATDPMAAIDIPHMVHETGHRLLGQEARDGVILFRIERR